MNFGCVFNLKSDESHIQTVFHCPLPEHTQTKIAFYSFPKTIAQIEIYSRLGNIDFNKARELSNIRKQHLNNYEIEIISSKVV